MQCGLDGEWPKEKKMSDKRDEINALLSEAAAALEKARELAASTNDSFYFEGPTYGMGGWIESGEWQASSHSC